MGESIGEDGADDRAAGAGPRSAGHRSTRVRRPPVRRFCPDPPPTIPATESSCPADPTRASIDPLVCHPDNPSRPPDWRWGRAGLLADGTVGPSRRHADGWVSHALRFRTALRACRGEDDHEALMGRMPEVYSAHSVYADPDPLRRWSLEARILSGESFDKVAGRYGVGEGVIGSYERLFFDVLDHLDTDYVPVVVIGLQGGHTPPGLDSIWKWFGFHGGPHVLDFLLGITPDRIQPGRSGPLHTDAEGYVLDELLKRVAVGALTLPADGRSAPKLLDISLRGSRAVRSAGESAPILEAMRPNLEAMWESLPPFIKTGPGSPTAVSPAGGVNPGS